MWLTKNEKMAISQPLSQNWKKTMGTLFSQTFKVEENKVPLVFQFWLWGWDIAIFSYFVDNINKVLCKSLENGNISAPEPKLKKLRELYFLQLWKANQFKAPFPSWTDNVEINQRIRLNFKKMISPHGILQMWNKFLYWFQMKIQCIAQNGHTFFVYSSLKSVCNKHKLGRGSVCPILSLR